MAQQLRPSKPADKQSKIDWPRRQEAENFAETVKLFRQGKIDPDLMLIYIQIKKQKFLQKIIIC